MEEAVDVGGGGDLEPGERLLGDAGAAHDVPPLEDEHAKPSAREVARGHQPVVPGADHDGVIPRGAQRHAVSVPLEDRVAAQSTDTRRCAGGARDTRGWPSS